MNPKSLFKLETFFTEKQIKHVLNKTVGDDEAQLICYDIRPAMDDGLGGFMACHLRLTLHVKCKEKFKKIQLFIKSLPIQNQQKREFIQKGNIFTREKSMFQALEEIVEAGENGSNPFCARAYLYTDSLIVMPDLSFEGYRTLQPINTMDLQHVKQTMVTLARFHAAFANYETRKNNGTNSYFMDKYGHCMDDPIFCDCPWLHVAAVLTADFLKAFSSIVIEDADELLKEIHAQYFDAFVNFKGQKDTLNVVNHKDLWVNNIMFKYDQDTNSPTNALLLDFQAIRYGPPTFDVMSFLYLVTSRSFRVQHEKEVLEKYYAVFIDSVDENTRNRLQDLNYDKEEFLKWCEKSRKFGCLEAVTISPYVMMDPKAGEKHFDDPETFDKYSFESRSEVVIEYSRQHPQYRDRILELSEEFIERWVKP